jgi:N-acetylglutamate synthase-like GNAT family acetyltransferase
MKIREAAPGDNKELLQLQSRCPQGTNLVYSVVNTPDFFGRAKAYKDYKVYLAEEDGRIIGSAACSLHNVLVNGKAEKAGYVFQTFVDPDYRGRHIAGKMYEVREEYLIQKRAALVYSITMEGNLPSIHHLTRQGFQPYSTLTLFGLAVNKHLSLDTDVKIRTAMPDDLPGIADLTNSTWENYELYEPRSGRDLQELISRTPGYSIDNLFLLEKEGKILACLGFWDWSQVIEMKVVKLNTRMKIVNLFLDIARLVRPVPRLPRPGEVIKQMILTPISYLRPEYLTPVLRQINNLALQKKIGYIYFICENDHPMLESAKGFTRSSTKIQVYIKYLKDNTHLTGKRLFIDGIDA